MNATTLAKPKLALYLGAAGAYVAAGVVAFYGVHGLIDDVELANTLVAALAVPLAWPLHAALRWIDRRF